MFGSTREGGKVTGVVHLKELLDKRDCGGRLRRIRLPSTHNGLTTARILIFLKGEDKRDPQMPCRPPVPPSGEGKALVKELHILPRGGNNDEVGSSIGGYLGD